MKSKLIVGFIAALAVIGGTLAYESATAAPLQQNNWKVERHEKRERHPEIRRAMRALENAELDLRRADRDFGGHRARAAELVHQALEECRAALRGDRR